MRYRIFMRRTLFLFAVLICCAGCGSDREDFVFVNTPFQAVTPTPTPTTTPVPAPVGSIAGRIVESDTGNPIQGAAVTATQAIVPQTTTLARTSGNATTDANGEFIITELDPGTYNVQATFNARQVFTTQALVEDMQITTANIAMWPVPGGVIPFQSQATDLVAGDANGFQDIFLRDRVNGTTMKVSTAVGTDGASEFPVLSDSERYLVFSSRAQLLAEDTDTNPDVYSYDRISDSLVRITDGLSGADASTCEWGDLSPFTAGTSRYTTFEWPSTTYGEKVVYLFDRNDSSLLPISVPATGNPDECSRRPVISQDETKLFFDSKATNLVPDDINDCRDIMQYDIETGTLSLVTKAADGVSPINDCARRVSCSADGRYLAFESKATNLVTSPTVDGSWQIYRRDLQTGQNELVSATSTGAAPNGESARPTISADGSIVAFSTSANLVPEDTNHDRDVYVRDMVSNNLVLISQFNGSVGDGDSSNPVIASDGSFIYYRTDADNLGSGASAFSQVVLNAVNSGVNALISVSISATPGNGFSDTRGD